MYASVLANVCHPDSLVKVKGRSVKPDTYDFLLRGHRFNYDPKSRGISDDKRPGPTWLARERFIDEELSERSATVHNDLQERLQEMSNEQEHDRSRVQVQSKLYSVLERLAYVLDAPEIIDNRTLFIEDVFDVIFTRIDAIRLTRSTTIKLSLPCGTLPTEHLSRIFVDQESIPHRPPVRLPVVNIVKKISISTIHGYVSFKIILSSKINPENRVTINLHNGVFKIQYLTGGNPRDEITNVIRQLSDTCHGKLHNVEQIQYVQVDHVPKIIPAGLYLTIVIDTKRKEELIINTITEACHSLMLSLPEITYKSFNIHLSYEYRLTR